MQALVFADLTHRKLSSTLGGNSLNFPQFVQGDTLRIGLRFSESVEGTAIEMPKVVTHIRASIGFVDARPTSGSFVLRTGPAPYVQGANQTTAIAHDATAGIVQAALASIGLSGITVDKLDGSWIVTNAGAEIDLSGSPAAGLAGELKPLSFVRVRSSQVQEHYRYEVRLVQAPIASTSAFETIVPPAPTVTRVQAGGSSATTVWPEIQAIRILPTFRGTYQIRRGFKKTTELSVDDGPEEIQDALAALADDDGSFTVSNPATHIAHVTFNGSMAGIEQDLLEIAVFSAPPGDPTFALDLNTAEIAAALRATDEIKPVLEIEVTVLDENDPAKSYVLTPFRAPVTLVRELNWQGLETAANIDWLRPPHGQTYVPFTDDQIITGSQHYVAPIGDGSNSVFVLSHNLGTRDLHVTIRENGGSKQVVAAELITFPSINTLAVGFASPPTEDQYVVTVSTAGPVSAFQAHNHTIAQVDGLQLILDDLGSRVETLESIVAMPGGAGSNTPGSTIEMTIPEIALTIPAVHGAPNSRPPLLGAIHDPTVETVAPPLGAADTFAGQVKKLNAAWTIPAARNRRAWPVAQDGHIASNGSVLYEVRKVGNSYFPVEYEHDLFMLWVAAEMFPSKRAFNIDAKPVLQLLGNARAEYILEVAFGTLTEATGTGIAANLAGITWATPVISQRVLLSSAIVTHPFNVAVRSDAESARTATSSIYGRVQTVTPPAASAFALRARLLNFDTEDRASARGLISLTLEETQALITTL